MNNDKRGEKNGAAIATSTTPFDDVSSADNTAQQSTTSTSDKRPPALAMSMSSASGLRAPPPPPLVSASSSGSMDGFGNGIGDVNGRSSPTPSTDSTSMRTRQHSDSVLSRHSTVHFDLDATPTQYPSQSALRPTSGHLYQPAHPSTLHTSTIPPPLRTAPALSRDSSSNSIMKPFPQSPSTSVHSSPHLRPILPRSRSSQERRVWSETLPPASHRSGSMLAHGKRVSRVTGGFETSTDEEDTTEDTNDMGGGETPRTPSLSETVEPPANAMAGPSRPRAKSLLTSVGRERQVSDASGGSRDAKRRKEDPARPKRRDSSRQPMSRNVSTRSTNSPPKQSGPLPTSRSDSFFGMHNSSPRSTRPSNGRPLLNESATAGPSRSPSSKISNLEKVRELASSPEGSRKSKGKQKESTQRQDGLAASLGLGLSTAQDMALSPDQLFSLLSDSDVSSALRMMNSPHVPATRPPHLNEWSNSAFFSPPTTRPGSPGIESPKHTSPYLVSAPPALTKSEGHGRERTMSVASSVAPPIHSTWNSSPRLRTSSDAQPPPEGFGNARRRASSKAGMVQDGQGGHVPFTHHVPMVAVEDQDTDDASATPTENLPAISEDAPAPARTPVDGIKAKKSEKEKRGRLSGLFHLGKRKSIEAGVPEALTTHKDHKTDAQKAEEKARDRERYEKDLERRRLEQERRDEELAQERRFRALTQVAAHPASERMAYRAGSHLRAYYQHIYDGIDNPPKLNHLAILRWRIKTDQQNEARRKWEQAQRDNDSSKSRNSTQHHSSPSNGHVKGTHFGENVHSSPMSIGSSTKFNGLRKSIESARSTSFGSLHRTRDLSKKQDGESRRNGWNLTVQDIDSYKACDGTVNYFIPPRPIHPDVEVLTEDEDQPTSLMPARTESRRDDTSSMAGSSRKDHTYTRTGVHTASNASLMEVEGVLNENEDQSNMLSRSASIETGRGGINKNRHSHRSHQSLSAIGQGSITHALKQPFEKLSNVAKKQRTAPPATVEDRAENQDHAHLRPESRASQHARLTSHNATPIVSKPSRTTMEPVSSRQRDQGFFRRHNNPVPSNANAGPDSYTDEEGAKDFHLRRLFLKGQRVLASFDDVRLAKRSEADLARTRQDERERELEALTAALSRETAFRERQAEATRRTQLELEAQERIKRLEDEIYAERVEHLSTARMKLDPINSYLLFIDESIKQYLQQVDFMIEEAKVAADVDLKWDSVDSLRTRYPLLGKSRSRNEPEDRDEHRDMVSPLRSLGSHDSASDSAHRSRSNSLPRRQRSLPQTQKSGQSDVLMIPRRKSTFRPPFNALDPQLTLHYRHHPRRTYLDPTGRERVNPVRQAELVIAFGIERLKDMGKEKEGMKIELEKMVGDIESMIKQKDLVRAWVREVLEKNMSRKGRLDRLKRQEELSVTPFGSIRQSLRRLQDPIYNSAAQSIGWVLRMTFWMYYQAKAELGAYLFFISPMYWISRSRSRSRPHANVDSNARLHSRAFKSNGRMNGTHESRSRSLRADVDMDDDDDLALAPSSDARLLRNSRVTQLRGDKRRSEREKSLEEDHQHGKEHDGGYESSLTVPTDERTEMKRQAEERVQEARQQGRRPAPVFGITVILSVVTFVLFYTMGGHN
ncbi:hypothetical protein IAU59_003091 [Kwoniella sp. CBS 9459]